MEKSAKLQVPIWEKANLTLDEAAAYFNIGKHKLRQLTNDPSCEYVLFHAQASGAKITTLAELPKFIEALDALIK